MRILLWTTSYLPVVGGLEWFVHDLGVQLLKQGHVVSILDGRFDRVGIQSLKDQETNDISIFRVPCPSPASIPEFQRRNQLKQLRQLLERINPDVVNLQFIGSQSYYALELREKLQYKLIATAQGSDLNNLDLRSRARQRLVKRCLEEADLFVACSSSLLSLAVQLVPQISDHSYVVPNGVKHLFFLPHVPSLTHRSYVIACGRLVPVKGFDLLLQAFSKINREPKPKLIIVGDGPERPTLLKMATTLGLSKSVQFRGLCSPKEIANLMRESAFCVVSSRQEGLSLIALEAMASGRAVIATAVGGLPEIVFPNYNGLLVEPENPVELAIAIERLLAEPQITEEMGKRGKEIAVDYRIELIAARYLDLYRQLA